MINILIFCLGFIVIIFFCIFLYMGATIFDLITFSDFNYIYTKINNDIIGILEKNNSDIEYNIAPNSIYIYQTSSNYINFDPMLNQISIDEKDKRTTLDINKDIQKLVPIFSLLKREFNFDAFNV